MMRRRKDRSLKQRRRRQQKRRRNAHPTAERLEPRLLLTAVVAVTPAANSHTAPAGTELTALLDENVVESSASFQTFSVRATQTGTLRADAVAVTADGSTISVDPSGDFFPGELLQATVTSDVQGESGQSATPFVWEFRIGTDRGNGIFTNSGQILGNHSSRTVSLGDLDGDGDLDAFVTNAGSAGEANRVWLNDDGQLFDSGQSLGNRVSAAARLGDVDGDGDLDAFVANDSGNHVWINDGNARFADSGQVLGEQSGVDVGLGDLDGDGDLDAFVTGYESGMSVGQIWINGGTGSFTGESFSVSGGRNALAIGDADADGDLDAFLANSEIGNRVWLNDGNAAFTDSGQDLGGQHSNDVAFGDVDLDGDLDAFVANWAPGATSASSRIWLNDGSGAFVDSGQSVGSFPSFTGAINVALGDLDGDGDLDAFVNSFGLEDRVWLNEDGVFTDSGQGLGNSGIGDVALGDLDGDADLDAIMASVGSNVVWLNDVPPTVTLSASRNTISEGGSSATLTATLSAATDRDVIVELAFSGAATELDDYIPAQTQIVVAAGNTTGMTTITAVADTLVEGDESIVIDVVTVTNGIEAGIQQVVLTLIDSVPVTLRANPLEIEEDGGVASFTAVALAPPVQDITVGLEFSGTATAGTDFSLPSTEIVISAGASSGSVTVVAIQDTEDEFTETIIAEIVSVAGGIEFGVEQATVSILDDDGVSPAPNSINVPRDTNVAALFDQDIDGTTVSTDSFIVHSSQSGRLADEADTVTTDGRMVTLDPSVDFFAGELVQATITAGILESGGTPVTPQVWEFRTAVQPSGGVFSRQVVSGDDDSQGVALGDLDGDGNIDVFVANARQGNSIWWNEAGQLVDSGQRLGDHRSTGVELGDVDGDGDLDAFVTNYDAADRIWLNEDGVFSDSGQVLGNHRSSNVSLGDVDADGDLDAFVANDGQANRVWLNENGVFTDSGQRLGDHRSRDVSLGDLDGDGDLDAFIANRNQGNRVWLNDGGVFLDSGQLLGVHTSRGIALGDLDRDGDLDAFVANTGQPNRVWINEGGAFVDSGQGLGDHQSYAVAFGDLDGDGDLDAFVINGGQANRVWLNEDGTFADSGQHMGDHAGRAVSLGDLDGDGDLDAFAANSTHGNRIWQNQNASLSITPARILLAEGNAGARTFDFTVTREFDTRGVVMVDYAVTGDGVEPIEETDLVGGVLPAGTLVFADGVSSLPLTVRVAGDLVFEPDETLAITLSNPEGGNAIVSAARAEGVIRNDDNVDTGDLPAPFRSLLADNGPTHVAIGPMLGSARDTEPDGLPDAAAGGDDDGGPTNDEDGVRFGSLIFAGQLEAEVTVDVDAAARLDAWIDFNGDESFDLPGEQIFRSVDLAAGSNTLRFQVPADARQGQTFSRFRLSSSGGLLPTGSAADGEVEDHRLSLEAPAGSSDFSLADTLGDSDSQGVSLGDLDGDGDLDVFVANALQGNRVWWNEAGQLVDSGQRLGNDRSTGVELGDVDGDGDLDAFVTNFEHGSRVWLNEDSVFSDSGQVLGNHRSSNVSLGDVDADGDLDAFVANDGQANRLWLNENGVFTDSGQRLGDHRSRDVSLGDLDGDGDLDAFIANRNQGNRVWLNDGGVFLDSGQLLGVHTSRGIALGDLDRDGDLDAFVANTGQPNRVWINEGGAFVDSGQGLGDHQSYAVAFGDLDGDGDLDAFVINGGQANRVWLNEDGTFADSGQHMGDHAGRAVSLGDLDGDGDLDAFAANSTHGNRIWQNQNASLSITPARILLAEGNAGARTFDFTVTREFDTRGVVMVDYAVTGDGVEPIEETDLVGGVLPAGTLVFADGVSSLPLTVRVAGDLVFEPDETLAITLSNPEGGNAIVSAARAEGVIRNDDNVDTGDLPAPFRSLLADNGPTHVAIGPMLGSARDTEPDGLPDAAADGDDDGGPTNDEDGVRFGSLIFAGQLEAEVTVDVDAAARLDAWIDFNGDESFDLPGEQIFRSVDLAAGSNTLRFQVPADARQGQTFSRFRLSRSGGLLPTGSAADGEVEDHALLMSAPLGRALFTDSRQYLGNTFTSGLSLGDLDGDRDLDIFETNNGQANRVWFNDSGVFTNSGQELGNHFSQHAALGDLDGDGDLDAFVTNLDAGNRIWLNEDGVFSDSGQILGFHRSRSVELGDVDGDGDLDAFVANDGQANRVWLNENGVFTDGGQPLGDHASHHVSLGDVDSDGDLDAFVANHGEANRVWLNANGRFTDSAQRLGDRTSTAAALGDLDGDGDLDVFVANEGQPNRIWRNEGGVFTDNGLSLGDQTSVDVAVGDVDGDGDLDAIVANRNQENQLWLYNGGSFLDGGQFSGSYRSSSVALGDLDGDGDLDVAAGNNGQANRIWRDEQSNTLIAVGIPRADQTEGDTGRTPFTFEVRRTGDTSRTTSINYAVAVSPIDAAAADREDFGGSLPSGTIDFGVGEAVRTVVIDVSGDTLEEPDETFFLEIFRTAPQAGTITNALAKATIRNDDGVAVPEVVLRGDVDEIFESSGSVVLAAVLSSVSPVPVTVNLEFSGTAELFNDYTVSRTAVVIPAGETSGSITIASLPDTVAESNESIVVEIASVVNGTESGEQSQTTIIIDDDFAPTFFVEEFTPTSTGFVVGFSNPVDVSSLSLYDAESDDESPDVVLRGQSTGLVAGSLVIASSGQRMTFVRTGGPLLPDTYTVTLESAFTAFKDVGGNLLDGNHDGVDGDSFRDSIVVSSVPDDARIVSLPDISRGPGQVINEPVVPLSNGLPLWLNDGSGVRAIDLRLRYDSQLLDLQGAEIAEGMPPGASVTINNATPGEAIISVSSPTDLPPGQLRVANLLATVPVLDAAAILGRQQLLDIHDLRVSDGRDNEFMPIDDDGIHVAAYFGDVSVNGAINAADASQVARVAASLDTGFRSLPLVDPRLVGDISGNRVINANDASLVARFAVQLPVAEIPEIPRLRLASSQPTGRPSQHMAAAAADAIFGLRGQHHWNDDHPNGQLPIEWRPSPAGRASWNWHYEAANSRHYDIALLELSEGLQVFRLASLAESQACECLTKLQ